MGRVSSLRAAIDRQAQALRAAVLQAPPPQAPQMVPPLCQPLPSSGSWPATPYQQAVQLPSKPKGRGVTFDSFTNKLVAMGSQDADGCGRQRTRGRDDNTRPASHSRGMHEGSSVRQPVSRHHPGRVSTPLVHLTMLPQLQHQGAPHTNAVVVRGLQRTP